MRLSLTRDSGLLGLRRGVLVVRIPRVADAPRDALLAHAARRARSRLRHAGRRADAAHVTPLQNNMPFTLGRCSCEPLTSLSTAVQTLNPMLPRYLVHSC